MKYKTTQTSVAPVKSADSSSSSSRPLGITVISILGMIGGIFAIVLGIFIILLGAAFSGLFGPLSLVIGGLIGFFAIILGLILLVANWLLWKMKKVGWIIIMILYSLGLIFSLMSVFTNLASIINIIIYGLVIFYLYKNRNLFR